MRVVMIFRDGEELLKICDLYRPALHMPAASLLSSAAPICEGKGAPWDQEGWHISSELVVAVQIPTRGICRTPLMSAH